MLWLVLISVLISLVSSTRMTGIIWLRVVGIIFRGFVTRRLLLFYVFF